MSGDTWEDFLNYDIEEAKRYQGEWGVDACYLGNREELYACIYR
jgi:hypothetical protein